MSSAQYIFSRRPRRAWKKSRRESDTLMASLSGSFCDGTSDMGLGKLEDVRTNLQHFCFSKSRHRLDSGSVEFDVGQRFMVSESSHQEKSTNERDNAIEPGKLATTTIADAVVGTIGTIKP